MIFFITALTNAYKKKDVNLCLKLDAELSILLNVIT